MDQSAGTVEYTDCILCKGVRPPQQVYDTDSDVRVLEHWGI